MTPLKLKPTYQSSPNIQARESYVTITFHGPKIKIEHKNKEQETIDSIVLSAKKDILNKPQFSIEQDQRLLWPTGNIAMQKIDLENITLQSN